MNIGHIGRIRKFTRKMLSRSQPNVTIPFREGVLPSGRFGQICELIHRKHRERVLEILGETFNGHANIYSSQSGREIGL